MAFSNCLYPELGRTLSLSLFPKGFQFSLAIEEKSLPPPAQFTSSFALDEKKVFKFFSF